MTRTLVIPSLSAAALALIACQHSLPDFAAVESAFAPVTVQAGGATQAMYFTDGAHCSDPRPITGQVMAPSRQPITFGLSSAAGAGARSACTLGATFYPEAGSEYELVYQSQGTQCTLSLYEERNGARRDITSFLIMRGSGNTSAANPYCATPLPDRPVS